MPQKAERQKKGAVDQGLPERREPKPTTERKPSGVRIESKSDSSFSSKGLPGAKERAGEAIREEKSRRREGAGRRRESVAVGGNRMGEWGSRPPRWILIERREMRRWRTAYAP